ncbi:MAG: S41 family peptidase [Bacteroides sp.]|nr:S41 family peptidase [Bacteroides sp.]MCM1379352.1 S41 family peptidase [Bacteroides sp.]MCM1445212.1 S41 family peptidase [Prevotella sp.]
MTKRTLIPLLASAAIVGGVMAETRSPKTDISRSLDIFNSLFREVQLNYVDTLDANKAINTAIFYMLDEIDPYTEYYSSEDAEDLIQLSTGEYGGVGSVINKGRDGRVRFSEPYENTPSWKAGVRAGDVILQIDTTLITKDFTVSQVSERLRGTAGTSIEVKVMRPYTPDSLLSLTIEREKIHNPEVPYFGVTGPQKNVGYIQLTSFTEKAPQAVGDAIKSLLDQGITSLVLDLQGNPGGLLESAVEIVGLFVDKGTEVVRTRGRNPKDERIYKTTRKPIAKNLPLAVLIDGGSASSAEIVAGALQDLDRAVIVGERSYGKGLVQQSRRLPYDGAVKITTAKYYIPSGRLIQAIDYSRRNPDGSVARTPDSLTTAYRTIHGREVRDGGGITPDRKVAPIKNNRLLYTVRAEGWDIDFANKFTAEHPSIGNPGEFTVSDSTFAEFKAFLDPAEFKYDKAYEAFLKTLRESLESEGYLTDTVAAEVNNLEALLRRDLSDDLELNRRQLEYLLIDAIVPRYGFRRAALAAELPFNEPLNQAVAILSSPEYSQILTSK